MKMEIREWRALGLGWAVAILTIPITGLSWPVPVVSTFVALAVYILWD